MNARKLGRWGAVMADPPATTTAERPARGILRPYRWARRTLGPNPDEDALLEQMPTPVAFEVGASVLALSLAAIGGVMSLAVEDGDDRFNIPVVLVMVVPWAMFLAGRSLPRWIFATWVLSPMYAVTFVGMVADRTPGEPEEPAFSVGAQFSLFLVALMLANFVNAPRPQAVAVFAAALLMVLFRYLADYDLFNMIIWVAAFVFVTAAGIGIRYSSIALIRTRDALAAGRASAERRRIARDVHDVVAHTLAVTMLHMTAARMAVQRSAPDDAVEALEEAERHGRSSLADIRRIIRVLREDDENPLDAAQPDLSDIASLVERYRSAGLTVDLRAHGSTESVSATTGLAAYRITQEALANAARHGNGGVTVELRVQDGAVRLRVWNPAPQRRRSADSHGSGLIGMRERVHAAGGTLEAGSQNGTWVVAASLPAAAPLEGPGV